MDSDGVNVLSADVGMAATPSPLINSPPPLPPLSSFPPPRVRLWLELGSRFFDLDKVMSTVREVYSGFTLIAFLLGSSYWGILFGIPLIEFICDLG